MTPGQKSAVQETFLKLVPIAPEAAALFYARLFELDPQLRALFKSDPREQGKKLMQMIGYCVNKLDRFDELTDVLRDLGRRHIGYGIKDADYATVGAALLWTLEQGLGAAFTPEVREAWTAAYDILSGTMRDGARAAAA